MNVAQGIQGVSVIGSFLVMVDLFPSFTSSIMGIDNTICQCSGALAPLLTGVLLDRAGCPKGGATGADESCVAAWYMVFYIAAAIYLVATLVFLALTQCDSAYGRLKAS